MAYDAESFSEDELRQLFEAGTAPEEIQALMEQRQVATELRHQKGADGRRAGGAYVAANPLEHLADAIRRVKADKDIKTADEGMSGTRRKAQDARKLYFTGGLNERLLQQGEKKGLTPGPSQIDIQNGVQRPAVMDQQLMASAIRQGAGSRSQGAPPMGAPAADPAMPDPMAPQEEDFGMATARMNPDATGPTGDFASNMGQPMTMSPEAFGANMDLNLDNGPQMAGSLQQHMTPQQYQAHMIRKKAEAAKMAKKSPWTGLKFVGGTAGRYFPREG